jgi:hypothetical protein
LAISATDNVQAKIDACGASSRRQDVAFIDIEQSRKRRVAMEGRMVL